LSTGKSVLFVAEKLAALQVVHRRLVSAGLGEFCLELHSTKANKRTVMNEIRLSLDASLQGVAAPQASTARLPAVRAELTGYVAAVHAPYGVLAESPYRAYGNLGAVYEAKRVPLQGDVLAYERRNIEDSLRDVGDLVAAAKQIGDPSRHAWRSTTRTFYSELDLDGLADQLSDLTRKLRQAIELASIIEESFGLPAIRNLGDVDTAVSIASIMARSPGAPVTVLGSDAWNAPPAAAKDLLLRGRKLKELRQEIEGKFSGEVFERDPADDVAYVEQKISGFFGFLAFLDGRYRSIRNRWAGLKSASYNGNIADQAAELRRVSEYLAMQASLETAGPTGNSLFGILWQGGTVRLGRPRELHPLGPGIPPLVRGTRPPRGGLRGGEPEGSRPYRGPKAGQTNDRGGERPGRRGRSCGPRTHTF
jgi:hypothetical protein